MSTTRGLSSIFHASPCAGIFLTSAFKLNRTPRTASLWVLSGMRFPSAIGAFMMEDNTQPNKQTAAGEGLLEAFPLGLFFLSLWDLESREVEREVEQQVELERPLLPFFSLRRFFSFLRFSAKGSLEPGAAGLGSL